jgi:hypothetical protein
MLLLYSWSCDVITYISTVLLKNCISSTIVNFYCTVSVMVVTKVGEKIYPVSATLLVSKYFPLSHLPYIRLRQDLELPSTILANLTLKVKNPGRQ